MSIEVSDVQTQPREPRGPGANGKNAADPPPVPAAVEERRARTAGGPPRRGDRLMSWLYLLLAVALPLAPLTFQLGAADVVDPREQAALSTTVQTWLHVREHFDWTDLFSPTQMTPVVSGEPEAAQPPGFGVLHMAAFALLPPARQNPDGWILAARIVSVAMTLLATAAVYWAGYSFGGRTTALLAAMIWAANPVVIYFGRLATPEMTVTGAVTLSIAAALWASRPLRPSPSLWRQAIGWTLCGLTLGGAVLAAGPRVLPLVGLSVLMVLLLCPNRVSHLLGLIVAVMIAGLMVMPWVVQLHAQFPQAWRDWGAALTPHRWGDPLGMADHAWQWLPVFLAALLPWTFWLIGAVLQPFSTSSVGARRRMSLSWVYSLTAFLMLLTLPLWNQAGAALPAIAATAVLLGQLFHQYHELAAEGRYPRLWRILRWPHINLLMAASVALPAAMYFQDELMRRGALDRPIVDAPSWAVLLGMAVLLTLLSALSLRCANANHPLRTVALWAVWVATAATLVIQPLADGALAKLPLRNEALVAASHIGDRSVYWRIDANTPPPTPNPALLIYLAAPYTPMSDERLTTARQRQKEIMIFTRTDQPPLPEAVLRMDWGSTGLYLWYVGPLLDPDTVPVAPQPAPDHEPTTPQAAEP